MIQIKKNLVYELPYDHYKQGVLKGRMILPIYEDGTFIFIGPLVQNLETDVCLGCALRWLKDNRSPYFAHLNGIIQRINERGALMTEEMVNQELILRYLMDIDFNTLPYSLYVIDKAKETMTRLHIFRHPACSIHLEHHHEPHKKPVYYDRRKITEELEADYRFFYGYDKQMDVLMNPHTGIGMRLQYYTPQAFIHYGSGHLTYLAKSYISRYAARRPFNPHESVYGSYYRLNDQLPLIVPHTFNARNNQRTRLAIEYDHDKDLFWTPVWRVQTESYYYLPEQTVYEGSQELREIYIRHIDMMSSIGIGRSLEEAIGKGILQMTYKIQELRERGYRTDREAVEDFLEQNYDMFIKVMTNDVLEYMHLYTVKILLDTRYR